jgi:hypothetical protein
MVLPPDHGKTLDAFRAGKTDFLEQQKRDLLQEAGGLAAAGNMAGARNKLYSGGNFDQAGNVSQEMRAQSAEQRAIQSHARSLDDMKLAKAAKSHELLGNMGNAILKSSNPQAALEQAKTILGQRGLKVENITIDQLPMLMQQNISAQDAFKNELQERQFAQEQAKIQFAQKHTDRSFSNELDQQRQAQANSDRTFLAGREDAAATGTFRELQQRLLMQRAQNQAAKQAAPKPLTEGQSTARNYHGVMQNAEGTLRGDDKNPGILAKEDSETPMGHTSNFLAMQAPDSVVSSAHLSDKQKQYMQGVMQWVRAKLRKESGATISADEFSADYRVYWPQPGDDAQTRRNKAKARKAVEEGFKTMGGYDAPGAPDAASADTGGDDDFKILGVE